MTVDVLEPRLTLIAEEYVLVQAWKKTASHIRAHNWYSDTLELDRAAVNLPRFLAEISEQLRVPDQWRNEPLRIVPAPKAQRWRVIPNTNVWEPADKGMTAAKLRPLAHVNLKDQVVATALMLCIANRVETLQGDPRNSIANAETRRRVISYGNRLLCDVEHGDVRHRWGSAKLYRGYYQDYRTFLSRPEIAAESAGAGEISAVVIVHSDLSQFYDRVRPALLRQKIAGLAREGDDPGFFALADRVLDWIWDVRDAREVAGYASQAKLTDFTRVALPQGLVAAGFFANVALLDFDQAMRDALSHEIEPGIRLDDVCRYVDDLRVVLTVPAGRKLFEVEQIVARWLQRLLDRHAQGLQLSREKTVAAAFRGDERPMVRQSRKMMRIQEAVSGGFDAIGGEEILDAIEGLIRSQQRYSDSSTEDQRWSFSPIPDVRDATVARFAAGRFRSTYRSLRPLLADREQAPGTDEGQFEENVAVLPRVARTRLDLDDEARAFALGLIEKWVENPSNVRLLRIGLDLWPAADLLKTVLDLLRPFTEKGGRRKAPRRVAWYCLAEIFRAAATETGFVEDGESLPEGVNIALYRSLLLGEAVRLTALPAATLPWYLRQQILLFIAAVDPLQAPISRTGTVGETRRYRELIRFLKGEHDGSTVADFATLATLSRQSFLGRERAVQLASAGLTVRRLELIAEIDPSFALEIIESAPSISEEVSPRVRDDLSLAGSGESDGRSSLAALVLQRGPNGPLRNELAILRFAAKFLEVWPAVQETQVVTPSDVRLNLRIEAGTTTEVEEVEVVASRVGPAGSMYQPPSWCPAEERWRFQLGYLLRFILAGRQDFTKIVRPTSWKENAAIYRAPESHWYQRLYGLFSAHSAFGDDWLPISEWIEQLLFALLAWPGCRSTEIAGWVRGGIETARDNIVRRVKELSDWQGRSGSVLMLPLAASRPVRSSALRPLRACIVQTVIPTPDDFAHAKVAGDPTFAARAIRRRHRNHLSAALAAVRRMLDLRETHKGHDGRLDWLILPELSVHPHDVQTHLIPFVREHRTIILAGLTYQKLWPDGSLINSALWIVPVWSPTHGLQVITRRQGKRHLSPIEDSSIVQGFRPCQWLLGYEWSRTAQERPLWLTASVCYDATDLTLAADLRDLSDIFAIPALNKDVTTFDQMALALHYHMFQLVIVANNGVYGGSNAYVPYRDSYLRQVFHLHGQPQASVAFLEIDNIAAFLQWKDGAGKPSSSPPWKFPPAGVNGN